MRQLVRMWKYVTRRRAVGAWILFVISVLLYALYPANLVGYDAVRQASLVVASIGLSAIFLPELSSELWSLKSSDIKALVPEEKVTGLQHAIVHSRVQADEWADCIIESGIEPLCATDQAPDTVIWDASYNITVHPECSAVLQEADLDLSLFECTLTATRRLPSWQRADVFWVTLARDYLSLRQEYGESGCIYREVSEINENLTDAEWREVALRHCLARAIINGTKIEAVLDPPYVELASLNPKVIRWFFVSADLAKAVDHAYGMEICFDYIQSTSVRSFPAMFSAYYIAGGLNFSFNVYPPEGRVCALHHETFLAQALPHVVDESVSKKPIGPELRVVTSDSSLIWPGSGIHVWWDLSDSSPTGSKGIGQ